jgi:competence protein ComEA
MTRPLVLAIFVHLSPCLAVGHAAEQELTTLPQCTLVATGWGDGDSFLIRSAEGLQHTIRLYGADCFEWHVNDDSDARRLREQRRYFGISEFGESPRASIDAAKALGKSAADEVAAALAQPFTVHTAFRDALGDGRHPRIYAFVTTAGGEDLAERLVRLGLARAFGVRRESPTGRKADDYGDYLRDVELQAAKRGAGAWAKTDWNRLPQERQAERQESAELNLASAAEKVRPGTKINPNTASRDQLMMLPGVGEVTANRIIEARPFAKAEDLLNVEGIGPKTLQRLLPFLAFP